MRHSFRRRGGFTLIEVVVVLLIFGFVLAMAAAVTRGVIASQNRSLTSSRMAGVDAALAQFVQQQKRLPCPADGTLDSTNNNAGVEGARTGAGCSGTLANGVVPWRALAISENDATDGWGRRLTYRLDPQLGADSGMDMSWCDPAGTQAPAAPATCSTTCTSTTLSNCTPPVLFLRARGLIVKTVAGVVVMDPQAGTALPPTGAAYVLISAGETGGGGYLGSGVLGSSTVTDGTEEQKNYASQAYVAGTTYYLDDSINSTSGAAHYDDIVSRPSVLSLASKAGLAPRTH